MTDGRAAYAKPPQQQDGELLEVGQQCSALTCSLVDFLPLKCQHCSEAFCSDHFTPVMHQCPNYDMGKYDRVAPSCPFCDTPVAIPPGEDPNLRMEQHINTGCSVMTGKTNKMSSMPVCARGKCGKKLFAPIKCDKCNQQFCPEHRYPTLHRCATTSASTKLTPATNSNLLSNLPAQTSAKSAAALAAFKRSLASGSGGLSPSKPTPVISTAVPSAGTMQSPPASSKPPTPAGANTMTKAFNLFSKQDRRAEAERRSQRKAVLERAKRERAKRSAASPEEQAQWDAEDAELANDDNNKDGCIVM